MLAFVVVGVAVYLLFLQNEEPEDPDKITVQNMYEEIKPEDVAYINVHNSYDDYTLIPYINGAAYSFYLKGHAEYVLDPEVLAYFKTYALEGFIVYDDDTGEAKVFRDVTEQELKDFGLDDASDPAYYEIYRKTPTGGEQKYVKAYIGRSMYASKQSYYVRLEDDPTTVYQIFHGLEGGILQPITSYIQPVIFTNIAYENSQSIMYQVGEFRLSHGVGEDIEDLIHAKVAEKNVEEDLTISFRRVGTGEKLDIDRMFTGCLNNILVGMTGESTLSLDPDEALLDSVGLGKTDPCYYLYVTYADDYSDNYDNEIELRVSDLQEDGFYYLMSDAYQGLLTRVPANVFECFNFSFEEWVDTTTFFENVDNVSSLRVNCEGYMNDTFTVSFNNMGILTAASEATGMKWVDTGATGYTKNNFRSFFMVLLTNTNWETVSKVSDEQLEAAMSNPASLLMTLEVTLLDGTVKTYEYYRVSQFYAVVVVNGEPRYEANLNHMDYMRRAMTYLYNDTTINYLSFFSQD